MSRVEVHKCVHNVHGTVVRSVHSVPEAPLELRRCRRHEQVVHGHGRRASLRNHKPLRVRLVEDRDADGVLNVVLVVPRMHNVHEDILRTRTDPFDVERGRKDVRVSVREHVHAGHDIRGERVPPVTDEVLRREHQNDVVQHGVVRYRTWERVHERPAGRAHREMRFEERAKVVTDLRTVRRVPEEVLDTECGQQRLAHARGKVHDARARERVRERRVARDLVIVVHGHGDRTDPEGIRDVLDDFLLCVEDADLAGVPVACDVLHVVHGDIPPTFKDDLDRCRSPADPCGLCMRASTQDLHF